MKKYLIVFLAALLTLLAAVNGMAFAEEPVAPGGATNASDGEETTVLLDTADFIRQLCALNAAAASANVSEEASAKQAVREFILGQFGLALGNDTPIERLFGQDDIGGYNLEAMIDVEGTDKCIVIGAHYDAVGEGANDNAVGVAVLFDTMKRLAAKQSQLPCDVLFVAFDCEEDGLVGSYMYVNNQLSAATGTRSGIDIQDVLVMFNADSVALGDNLYLMCENKHTDLADLILSKSQALTEKPYAKGVTDLADNFGYGYYEFVQGTDHTPFRLSGVPTASFFAGNFDLLGYVGGSEMNTDDDTFDNLVNSNPDYLDRVYAVSGAICDTVTDENFMSVANNARKQLINNNLTFNRWWPSLVVLGVLIILAVFAVLYYRKLQKKALLGNADVKTGNVFDKPAAEDIFSFDKGSSDPDSDDDIDGIFTFKK